MVVVYANYKGQDTKVIKLDYEFKNKITKVEISKQDITDSSEIEGANLIVFDKGNEAAIVDTWTSTKEKHLIKGLEVGIEMCIVDNQNEISVKRVGTHIIEENKNFPYVSFVPVTEIVEGITLLGFKYPLTNKKIEWGSTLCISNELVEEKGTFSFTSGILMVIRSTD